MARFADKQPISTHPELAPDISQGVVKAWEAYSAMSGRDEEKAQIRSADIAATLHDFAGLKGPIASTYEAAYLIELMEKQSGDDKLQAEYAYEAIKSYKGKTQQDTDYVRGIAADRLEIGLFLAEHYQQTTARQNAEQVLDSPWKQSDEIEIPLKDIFHLIADIPGEGIEDPIGVNIESILIAAASAYNTLRNDEDFSEEELLKTIYDIENLYQPFLAYVRYDGFETALKNAVGLVRKKYGKGVEGIITDEDVEYATALLHETGLDDYGNVINTVPKVLRSLFPNSDAVAHSVLHHISNHGVKTGIASLYLESDPHYLDFEDVDEALDDDVLSVRWRAKDPVSVAENNHENPNAYIADLLGLTVIVPSYEAAAEMMAIAYRSSQTFLSVEAKNSASRDTPISVKGSMMSAVVVPILMDRLGDLEIKIGGAKDGTNADSAHQVGKITFSYRHNYRGKVYDVPVEVMFQTPEDRDISNVGEAAHALKNKKYRRLTPQEIRFQRRFHERRMIISEPGLTERSRERAELLFSRKKPKNKRGMGGLGIREFVRSDKGTTIDV